MEYKITLDKKLLDNLKKINDDFLTLVNNYNYLFNSYSLCITYLFLWK